MSYIIKLVQILRSPVKISDETLNKLEQEVDKFSRNFIEQEVINVSKNNEINEILKKIVYENDFFTYIEHYSRLREPEIKLIRAHFIDLLTK